MRRVAIILRLCISVATIDVHILIRIMERQIAMINDFASKIKKGLVDFADVSDILLWIGSRREVKNHYVFTELMSLLGDKSNC